MKQNVSWIPATGAPAGIYAGVTTRWHPQANSAAQFSQFNLADHTGDSVDSVGANRRILKQSLADQQLFDIQWLKQVHGISVLHATPESSAAVHEADAMWTGKAGLALAIMTADCIPILLADKSATTVAAIHAGWQGLVNGVVEETIAALPCLPGQLWAWLGPGISQHNYEVGEEVWEQFSSEHLLAVPGDANKRLLDLPGAVAGRLKDCGVQDVHCCDLCTYADERFFSHRECQHQFGHAKTGRIASIVGRFF